MLRMIIISMFFVIISPLFAKDKVVIDSLNHLLKSAVIEDQVTLKIELAEQLMDPTGETSLVIIQEALELAKETGNEDLIAFSLYKLSELYYDLESRKKSLNLAKESEKVYLKINDLDGAADALLTQGAIYFHWADYQSAQESFYMGLKHYEMIGNEEGIAQVKNSLGTVLHNWRKDSLALDYLEQSLALFEKLGKAEGVATACNNIGNIYFEAGNYEKTLEYNGRALEIREKEGSKEGIATSLNNIGNVYLKWEKYDDALEYYERAKDIYIEIGYKRGYCLSFYNIGFIHELKENYDEALVWYRESLDTAIRYDLKYSSLYCYEAFTEVYAAQGRFEEALEAHRTFKEVTDSLFNAESHQQVAELETRYETEKKEKELEIQNLKLDKQEEEIQNQRNVIISFVFGILLIMSFLLVLLKMFRQKRKANILLEYQNEEILQQKEEIETQRDEIEVKRDEIKIQRDEANRQRDLIANQNEEITDSIHYARRIQSAISPSIRYFKELLPQSFIAYLPRDIVSGDFYWIAAKNSKIIVATADCTGHGVPGAMMSMLGIAFLNEIVGLPEDMSAGKILDMLRDRVIQSLNQAEGARSDNSNTENDQANDGASDIQPVTSVRDGMDIALYIIDKKNMTLQFSGANNPLYIIRSEDKQPENSKKLLSSLDEEQNRENHLFEIKGDKMPIGVYNLFADNNFTNNTIELLANDNLFTFTDGYIDQFGGPHGRKMKIKPFRHKLMEICQQEPKDQKEELINSLMEWKGGYEQIDDILVIGVRI